MTSISRKPYLALLVVVLLSSFFIERVNAQTKVGEAAAAKADAVVALLRQSCAGDIKTYCSQVTAGEGRLALCVLAHEDKISDGCYSAILDFADRIELAVSNVWRAGEACDADIEKQCGQVEPGEGRIAQCLIDNKAKLDSSCSAEVAGIQARLKK